MIVDAILLLSALAAMAMGFRRGFLQTVFSTLGYVGGGVLGLAVALNFAKDIHSSMYRFMAILLAIFLCAEFGRQLFGGVARFFRTKILWLPIRFLDSVAGAALELVRVVVIAYLVASVLLWSPWSAVHNAISESSIYPKITKQAPRFIEQLRTEIEKKLSTNPL